MKENFDEAIKRVLEHEGGYSNDAHDPGGPTNWGITIADYRKYISANGTAADVRAMPVSAARGIYRQSYWNDVHGDDLPSGVDYCVFDFGVNSGPRRAIKYLQMALGVAADGLIGPQTMAAVAKSDAGELIMKICSSRLSFLKSLATWRYFGTGWSRRVAEVRAAALAMANVPHPHPDVPKPKPLPPTPKPAPQPATGGFFNALKKFFIFSAQNQKDL